MLIAAVVKPFQTLPATVSTKKEPGFCIECFATATTEALFKVDGVVMIRKYCNTCISSAEYETGKH
jgi:hypothetical protein